MRQRGPESWGRRDAVSIHLRTQQEWQVAGGGGGWQGRETGYNLHIGESTRNRKGKTVKNPEMLEVSV